VKWLFELSRSNGAGIRLYRCKVMLPAHFKTVGSATLGYTESASQLILREIIT
jgi:hypothetical protein